MSLLLIASNLASFTDTELPSAKVAYQIEVLNPNECGGSVNGRMDQAVSIRSNVAKSGLVTGIEKSLATTAFIIYPNPVDDILKIDKGKSKEAKVTIWNSGGKLINSISSKQQVTYIDMSGYAAGVYLIKINDQFSHKVVKE